MTMITRTRSALLVAAVAACLFAPSLAHLDFRAVQTNVCGVNWYYCPRDPGCKTYTMSAHAVHVHANNYQGGVAMDKLKVGDSITLQVTGVTQIQKVPTSGSFRIYALDGKNVATGILTNTLNITYNSATSQYDFVFETTFTINADCLDSAKKWTEWTLDVFQQKSGSDEGMCIEFADTEYVQYEQSKPDPKFEDYCVDNGDGSFRSQNVMITEPLKTLHPLQADVACTTSQCDLRWNWCPRDPGCKTYTMNVASVETDISGAQAVQAGDKFTVIVRGTTSMTTVPIAGSYRIYALSGGNVGTGILTDVLTIDKGTFVMKIPFIATAPCFDTSKDWFEFGIDVFQKKSGSDEGMCIEITNPTYNEYEKATLNPPFVTDCDMSSFPFRDTQPKGTPEVTHDVVCKFV